MAGEVQRALGRNLRALRLDRKLTQEEFADLLRVHRTYMGALERGERNITLQTLERLALRVGVAPAVLLAETLGQEEPPPRPGA